MIEKSIYQKKMLSHYNASQRELYQLVSKRLSSALLWIDHHHSLHRFVELLFIIIPARV